MSTARDERNRRIVEALRAHGTIIGAAKTVGCDRGTVRRLVERDDTARVALLDGASAKEQERIAAIEATIADLKAIVDNGETIIEGERRHIIERFTDMTHADVKEAESAIEQTIAATSQGKRKLREMKQRLRQALASCQFRHAP